jgi:hypothetical protein
MVSFMARPLYQQEKSPRYPFDWRLVGPPSRSERCREEKKILQCRGSKPGHQARSPSLYRLSNPGSFQGSISLQNIGTDLRDYTASHLSNLNTVVLTLLLEVQFPRNSGSLGGYLAPCDPVEIYQRFGGTYCLYLRG